MSRLFIVSLSALLVQLVTALVLLWRALSLDPATPAHRLRLYLLMATGLAVLLLALCGWLYLVARRERRRLEDLGLAMRLKRALPLVDSHELASFWNESLASWQATAAERDQTLSRVDQDDRLASLGRLASSLAHEIKSPLTTITGYAELAREKCEDDNLREDLATILAAAQRSVSVTDSILAFARTPQPRREAVDLAELLPADAGLAVEIEAPVEARRLMADRILLQRVFANLCRNAAQAGARRMRINGSRRGGELVWRCADDGPGLPAALAGRIFEPFATTRPDGLGLGLALVRNLIMAHGGTIVARNRPEGGAEFEIVLPVK